jgi:hypothetical protein
VVHSSIFWISKWMWPLYTQHAATLSVFPKKKGISCVFIGKKKLALSGIKAVNWHVVVCLSHYISLYGRLLSVIWCYMTFCLDEKSPVYPNTHQPAIIHQFHTVYIYI